MRSAIYCYLRIVLDKLPAWSKFWQETPQAFFIPIPREVYKLKSLDSPDAENQAASFRMQGWERFQAYLRLVSTNFQWAILRSDAQCTEPWGHEAAKDPILSKSSGKIFAPYIEAVLDNLENYSLPSLACYLEVFQLLLEDFEAGEAEQEEVFDEARQLYSQAKDTHKVLKGDLQRLKAPKKAREGVTAMDGMNIVRKVEELSDFLDDQMQVPYTLVRKLYSQFQDENEDEDGHGDGHGGGNGILGDKLVWTFAAKCILSQLRDTLINRKGGARVPEKEQGSYVRNRPVNLLG